MFPVGAYRIRPLKNKNNRIRPLKTICATLHTPQKHMPNEQKSVI